ncbi:MAG: hypothetical protein QMC77_07140 [Methanocellales archaeon]|nr:hypothetical protein [Methanocellales archaeon]
MEVKNAVFATVSVRPQKISELKEKLPHSESAIYKAVEALAQEGLVVTRKDRGEVVVSNSSDYRAQKLREIYLKALSYGVNPEQLLRDSVLLVWGNLEKEKSLTELMGITGLSYPTVYRICDFLVSSRLLEVHRRKPLLVSIDEGAELNRLLKEYMEREPKGESVFYRGVTPFRKIVKPPPEVERILYEKIEEGVSIQNTGFTVRGKGALSVVESVEKEFSLEEIFLRELNTTAGIEDLCIHIIASRKLDYDTLLELAKKKDTVNVVGCYLNIIHDLSPKLVKKGVVEVFIPHISKNKMIFLKKERKYGKEGWEKKYEKRWNVDLYLDIGAIGHGVRGV